MIRLKKMGDHKWLFSQSVILLADIESFKTVTDIMLISLFDLINTQYIVF